MFRIIADKIISPFVVSLVNIVTTWGRRSFENANSYKKKLNNPSLPILFLICCLRFKF